MPEFMGESECQSDSTLTSGHKIDDTKYLSADMDSIGSRFIENSTQYRSFPPELIFDKGFMSREEFYIWWHEFLSKHFFEHISPYLPENSHGHIDKSIEIGSFDCLDRIIIILGCSLIKKYVEWYPFAFFIFDPILVFIIWNRFKIGLERIINFICEDDFFLKDIIDK